MFYRTHFKNINNSGAFVRLNYFEVIVSVAFIRSENLYIACFQVI